MPQHFSRAEKADADRAWLRENLQARARTARRPARSRWPSCPTTSTSRTGGAGRAGSRSIPRPGCRAERFEVLIDNLHRAAEICRAEGLEPVLHPHAGTYVETADEIARVMDRIDPSLVGLCLDTGHFRFGGADPARSVVDYGDLDPPRPHQGLQDVGHGRRRAPTDKGLETALKRGVFCPLRRGRRRTSTAVIAALRGRRLPRLAGRRAGPGAGHERHARLGHRRPAVQPASTCGASTAEVRAG